MVTVARDTAHFLQSLLLLRQRAGLTFLTAVNGFHGRRGQQVHRCSRGEKSACAEEDDKIHPEPVRKASRSSVEAFWLQARNGSEDTTVPHVQAWFYALQQKL